MYSFKNLIVTLLMLLAACLGGGKAYLDYWLQQKFNHWIASVASEFTVNYGEIKTNLAGNLTINQLVITLPKTIPIYMDAITVYSIYQFYPLHALPKRIAISVKNINFPIGDSNPPVPILVKTLGYAPYYVNDTMMRKLGYLHFNSDLDCEMQLSEKQSHFSAILEADRWGHLEIRGTLQHDASFLEKTFSNSVQLNDFVLNYSDRGLVNQVLTLLAQRDAKNVDEFKQGLLQKITKDIHRSGISLDNGILISLAQFINNPKLLTLFLQPNPPLFLHQLNTVRFEQLGLRMTAL